MSRQIWLAGARELPTRRGKSEHATFVAARLERTGQKIPADLMSENDRYPTQTGAKVGGWGASLGERAQAPIIIGPGRDFSTCSHGDTDKSAAYSSGEVAGRLHTVDRRCRSLLSQCSLNRGRDASSVCSRRSPDPLVGLWRHHAHADCTVSDTSPGSDTNT